MFWHRFLFSLKSTLWQFSFPSLLRYYNTVATMCFSIVEGEESFRKFSPQVLVKDVSVVSLLHHIIPLHGTSVQCRLLKGGSKWNNCIIGFYNCDPSWGFTCTMDIGMNWLNPKMHWSYPWCFLNSMVLKQIFSYIKERGTLIYFFRLCLFRVLYSLSFQRVSLFGHFDLTKILECFILSFLK
jgi:hypothetical protein